MSDVRIARAVVLALDALRAELRGLTEATVIGSNLVDPIAQVNAINGLQKEADAQMHHAFALLAHED